MDIVLLVLAMLVVGAFVGALAGVIWKGQRPLGAGGDYAIAIVVAVAVGLIDYFVIPAMGFSETIKWLGVALEPLVGALLALYLVRVARRRR